jgi:hypothetical protein
VPSGPAGSQGAPTTHLKSAAMRARWQQLLLCCRFWPGSHIASLFFYRLFAHEQPTASQAPPYSRTHQPDGPPVQAQLMGRDQLLLKSPELQSQLGQRYCDESELLPLLLSHGLVSRVRTIEVAVHPLGGDNFKIRLDATTGRRWGRRRRRSLVCRGLKRLGRSCTR